MQNVQFKSRLWKVYILTLILRLSILTEIQYKCGVCEKKSERKG